MPIRRVLACSGLVLCNTLGTAAAVSAQPDPPVGVRAAGMGGAFTAVADDASATVWNPAGLASGSYFSVAVDRNDLDRQSALFAGIGTPALGITYFRTATGARANGRNTLVAHHTGVSLVVSLGDSGVAVGATVKLVHGVTWDGASSIATNTFDADVGVMAAGALGQIGLTIHNVRQPEFAGGPDGRVRLDRRVRGGVSVHPRQHTTVAADLEFTTATTPRGAWRDAAIGVETQSIRHAWLRAGVRWNTARFRPAASAGQARAIGASPTATAGASYAIRGSMLADVQGSAGSAKANRGWGLGVRFVF